MKSRGSRRFHVLKVYTTVLLLMSVCTAIGGVDLLALGGSPYYLIAGVTTTLSCIQVWRRRESGILIYAAMLLGTFVWAFWEVGLDGWALTPRLIAPLVLGALLFLLWTWVMRATISSARKPLPPGRWLRLSMLATVALAVAIGIGEIGHKAGTDLAVDPAYQAGMATLVGEPSAAARSADRG